MNADTPACRHSWEAAAHVGNLRIAECRKCFLPRREEDGAEDTLSRRLRSGYYAEQTRADPDMREMDIGESPQRGPRETRKEEGQGHTGATPEHPENCPA